MKNILTIIAFTLVLGTSFAQVSNDPNLLIKNRGSLFGYISTFAPDPEIEGDYLYFEKTVPVTLYLKDGKGTYKIENANIDLINQAVLVDIQDNMYSINYTKIDSAIFLGLRVMDYQHKSATINASTMAMVISQKGNSALYKTIDIQVIKPTYNEALDAGNRNYTLQHKVKYYIDIEGRGILDLSKKLKSFKGTDYYDQVKKFVKQNATDFSSDKDMIRLNEFITTII